MGSPLAPLLPNTFMGFWKSKWLNKYNLNNLKFYLRYADDILAAFDKGFDKEQDLWKSTFGTKSLNKAFNSLHTKVAII